jgi:hypothetical protein
MLQHGLAGKSLKFFGDINTGVIEINRTWIDEVAKQIVTDANRYFLHYQNRLCHEFTGRHQLSMRLEEKKNSAMVFRLSVFRRLTGNISLFDA